MSAEGEWAVLSYVDNYPDRVVFTGSLAECIAKADELDRTAPANTTHHVDANVKASA